MSNRRPTLLLIALSVLACLIAARPVSAQTPPDQPVPIGGHVLSALAQARPVVTPSAAVATTGARQLTLTLTLKRDDRAGFDAFVRDVHDPASPGYGRFAD